MKKQQTTPSLEKNTLLSALEENPAIEWLEHNGKTLLYVFLGLVALLFIIYRMSAGRHAKAESDYLQASVEFAAFQKGESKESLERLTAILGRRPELHAQYDGLIAQILLNNGDLSKAKEFANLALKRTSTEDLPYYSDFAKTTLLISEHHEQEALNQALALKKTMQAQQSNQSKFGPVLFAFNLLRVAMLQQQLGLHEEEAKTWKEWKDYANASEKSVATSISPRVFETIENQLAEGKFSLSNYIESRQNKF